MQQLKLADITKRVDGLIKQFGPGIEQILEGLTAEDPHIAALFDCSDREGMEIYREVGLTPGGDPGSYLVLDILQQPLDAVLRRHNYVPVDELPDYHPGSVLLYVFTQSVVVARRFEEIAGARRGLREVRRTRDVEFEPTGLFVEGAAALEVIVQRCAVTLRGLWDGSDEGVALIQKASHGAKAGFLERGTAIEGLRDAARRVSLPDRTTYDGMVSSLERGPGDGRIQCILQGWGTVQILNLTRASLDTRSPREFGKPEEDVLQQYIVACRDRKRALGLFEKMLDKLGSTTVSSSLADLLSLLRHDWDDCDGILAKHAVVVEASTHLDPTEATSRLRCALSALWQATTERKRGGVVNARGGKG